MATAAQRSILEQLGQDYHWAKPGLQFTSAFELLIATILSAQCTDQQVNKVTEPLFAQHPDARAILTLSQGELEHKIHSCGFYHMKAKHILETCQALLDQYDGEVPDTREALMKLPGVGRKTANVVISNAFGADAIAVDTHVFRVSNRLGLATARDVDKTEQQLMKNIPQSMWSSAHHWLITHGRQVCSARNPKCDTCNLRDWCRYHKQQAAAVAKAAMKKSKDTAGRTGL